MTQITALVDRLQPTAYRWVAGSETYYLTKHPQLAVRLLPEENFR